MNEGFRMPAQESPRRKLEKALGLPNDATDEDIQAAFKGQDSDGQAFLDDQMEGVFGKDWEKRTLN